jgi:hypothetical protein
LAINAIIPPSRTAVGQQRWKHADQQRPGPTGKPAASLMRKPDKSPADGSLSEDVYAEAT